MSKLRSVFRTRSRRSEETVEYGFMPEIISYPLGTTFTDADLARLSIGGTSINTQFDGSQTLVSLREPPPLPAIHRLNGQILHRIVEYIHPPSMFAFWESVDRHRTLLRYGTNVCRSWRYALIAHYHAVMAYRISGDGTLRCVPVLPPTDADRSVMLKPRALILDITGCPDEDVLVSSMDIIVGESSAWSQVRALYLNIDIGNGDAFFNNKILTGVRLLARTVGECTPALHTIWYNYAQYHVVAPHRHLFSRILNPRIRHINHIHISSNTPVDLELAKHAKSRLGRLDIDMLTSNINEKLVQWLAPSLGAVRLSSLTLGKLVDILLEPTIDRYYVLEALERLRLEFDEVPLPEGMVLGERNSLEIFPALRVLEIDAFAYDIQVFLRLFAGARKLTSLAMTDCNNVITELVVDQLPDTLRNFSVSFDMAKWTVHERQDAVQGLIDRLFQTQLSFETLVLGITNSPRLLNLPTTAIWHSTLRDLTITAPMRFAHVAKFISLHPNLHTLHLDLVDDGDGSDDDDTSVPNGPVSRSLRTLCLTAASTAAEGARLEFGVVLLLARIPSIRTLIAPTLVKDTIEQCIRYVTSNELITSTGGHLHNLKYKCIPE